MGATQDKFVFRQKEPHIFIHTLIIVFISRGHCIQEEYQVCFLVNLKIGLLHYEKKPIHLHQSNAALTCLFQPYVLAFDGVDIHSREHALF